MKKLLLIILTLVAVFLTNQCNGTIIYVDDDANGLNDGTSWQNVYKYLQDALTDANYSPKPVEIRVAQGIYKPDQGSGKIPSDREATFQLINGVTIKGGYAGLGQPDPNARHIEKYETILSGDLAGNDADVNDPCDLMTEPTRNENSYHLFYHPEVLNLNNTSILDGFTITGGKSDIIWPHIYGGGMYNYKSSPTLTDCKLSKNSAIHGGGMHNDSSSPMVNNCNFNDNSAWIGGGMYNYASSPTVNNCIFSGNLADWDGGGMCNGLDRPTVTNCNFSENSADYGGGMHNNGGILKIVNCNFKGNLANYGGGMYNYKSKPTVTNCTFNANSVNYAGVGMFNRWYGKSSVNKYTLADNNAPNGPAMACDSDQQSRLSNVTMVNCIIWNGPNWLWNNDNSIITITYSDIEGDWEGEGNISDNPCFVDPNGPDVTPGTEDDDLRLNANSPCIDAGDSNAVPLGILTDVNESPRFIDDPNTPDSGVGTLPIVDMGSYEFQDDVFKYGECYPQIYSIYRDWLAFGKPNCWCGMYGNPPWPYQYDGDTDNKTSGLPFYDRVSTGDLALIIANWKKKAGDPTLDPCADIDHKDLGLPFR